MKKTKAKLAVIAGTPFENVSIYPPGKTPKGVRSLYKKTFVWECRDGVHSTDIDNVDLIMLSSASRPPRGSDKHKCCCLTVGSDASFEHCTIVANPKEAFKIPSVLGEDMIGFVNKDGTFLTTPDNINLIKHCKMRKL